MKLRLRREGANAAVLEINDAAEVLFSYETAVAVRCSHGKARIESPSVTTSKHINAFGAKDWPKVDGAAFAKALGVAMREREDVAALRAEAHAIVDKVYSK